MKLLTNTGITKIKEDFPPKKYCTGVITISSSSAPAVQNSSLVGLQLSSFIDGNADNNQYMTLYVRPKESYNKLLSMSVFFYSGQSPAAANTVFNVTTDPGTITLMYGNYGIFYRSGSTYSGIFSKSIFTSYPLYVHVLLVYN